MIYAQRRGTRSPQVRMTHYMPAADTVTAIHAARGLRSIIHGFVSLELADGFGLVLDHDASFVWVLRGYIAGVRAARTP